MSPSNTIAKAAPIARGSLNEHDNDQYDYTVNSFREGINLKKIACLGAGYVGGPTMAMIAHQCPEVEVHVLDISESRIAAWQSDNLPIYEPGLDEIVKACRGRNLFFSTDVKKGIEECGIIFVSVNTPTKTYGMGAGSAADLSSWEKAGRSISRFATTNKILVEKSTVPVRTAEALTRVVQANCSPHIQCVILSNPEFLAEGTAMDDLKLPDRVLIGGPIHDPRGAFAMHALKDIYSRWIPPERVLTTNLWSAEMSKLVANAFLAQRISSMNTIAALCERTGADVTEVSRAIGTDSRIGSKFLKASVGFGGSCFKKDILNLVYICESFGLPEVADYWRQVVTVNEWSKQRFVARAVKEMFGTVRGKKIAVLGFAFKKDTGDVRESPAVDVCSFLLKERAEVAVFDPKAEEQDCMEELRAHGVVLDAENRLNFAKSHEEAINGAHAIFVLTEWDEFKSYNYSHLISTMQKPACFFDGRNLMDGVELERLGFIYKGVGRHIPRQKNDGIDIGDGGVVSPRFQELGATKHLDLMTRNVNRERMCMN